MKKITTTIIAGMFFLSLHGPLQAQKEVEPPAIPPMLEDKPPLVQPEPKASQAPAQAQEQKTKSTAKTKVGKKKGKKQANLKKKGKKSSTAIGKKKRGNTVKKKGVTAKPKQQKTPNST